MAKRELQYAGTVPLDAGQRDRAVTIQQRASTPTVDASGFPVDESADTGWSALVAPVWMRKFDLAGREAFKANQESASADTQWEMGYREDMDPELVNVPKRRRLIYQGRVYDITAASLIGMREGIELLTIARVG